MREALWGHMTRANPQWQIFDPARPVPLIFTGAHAYVSAALYERVPAPARRCPRMADQRADQHVLYRDQLEEQPA
jgi:predicted FMN-binding regulatory protein PaiB